MGTGTELEDPGRVHGEEKETLMSLLLKQVQAIITMGFQHKYHCQERPRYYKDEEEPCTGLCLIKKMEALEAESKKKNKKKKNKKETLKLYEEPKPKKKSAPCTGMCALMRQRTG